MSYPSEEDYREWEAMKDESYPVEKDYREWSEMKAEGIEIETMQEYIDEVRGFNDHEPEPMDAYDYDREFGARDAYLEEQAELDGNDDDYMDDCMESDYREIDCGGFD